MTRLSGSGLPADGFVERRVAGVAVGLIAVWALLLSRLFFLQVVEGDAYHASALRNSVRTHRVQAPRGMILDRSGAILVDSRPSFDVLVVPSESAQIDLTLKRVADLGAVDAGAVSERLGRPSGAARFRPQRIAADLDRDAIARIEARLWALDGVLTEVAPVRAYHHGDSSAHLLGGLGEITAEQLASREFQGYRRGDVIGRKGIEKLLDRELRGRSGGENVLVDAHGRELELLDRVDAQPGHNVVLTLDHRMQSEAERALDETEKSGAVVALDPRSGEVHVLTSRPAFDPNDFAAGIDRDTWQGLLEDPRVPLHNRALQGQYPPGSTYKIVTAIGALEKGLITPETEITCTGSYRLGRRRYRCWRRGGHGPVDLHKALVQSCDVYFYKVGYELGVDNLAYYARILGLGRRSGIEIPGEATGLVPTRAWKKRRFGQAWLEGETISLSIGQGFNLWTPLQLATTYAALARRGERWRPHVVARIEEPGGRVVRATEPELLDRVPVSAETYERVAAALRGVVHEPRGTGYVMRGLAGGVEAAGKTGTAQVVAMAADPPTDEDEIPERHRDHAWFVTWLPAADPELVIAVLVEHGGHGGSAAAPIARRVADVYLAGRAGSSSGSGAPEPVAESGPDPGPEPEAQVHARN